jgi:hypothetical protein
MKQFSSLSQVVLLVVCSAPFVLGQSAAIKDFNDVVPQKQNIDKKEDLARGLAPPRQLCWWECYDRNTRSCVPCNSWINWSNPANHWQSFQLTEKHSTIGSTGSGLTGGAGAANPDLGQVQQAVGSGSTTLNKCKWFSDGGSNSIAAFDSKLGKVIGTYANPGDGSLGIGLVMRPPQTAQDTPLLIAADAASPLLNVFKIQSDCSLALANSVDTSPNPVGGMAVSPDGKILVVSYAGISEVDSFAISGTKLAETGPYASSGPGAGVDITQDGKYAIFGDGAPSPQIGIFPIRNGRLGTETTFTNVGPGSGSYNVRLSPSEKFLYVANTLSRQVTTLNFSEKPLNLTFNGCITTMDNPNGDIQYVGGVATGSNLPGANAGRFLYVAEDAASTGYVGLLKIDSKTGCTTEVPNSPFATGASGPGLLSVSPDPPRLF